MINSELSEEQAALKDMDILKKYPVEILYKDAKFFQIYLGTNEIQCFVIAAVPAKKYDSYYINYIVF